MDEIKERETSVENENAIDYRKCFAYPTENFKAKSGCGALTEMMCKTEGKCPFFKSKDLFHQETIKYGKK